MGCWTWSGRHDNAKDTKDTKDTKDVASLPGNPWGRQIVQKATGNPNPVEYLVLTANRTGRFQKELNEAAARGYRFATVFSGTLAGDLRGRQLVAVMQRVKGRTTRTHEQVLLATQRFSTMEKELAAEETQGFRVVGQTIFNPPDSLFWKAPAIEFVAILERGVH